MPHHEAPGARLHYEIAGTGRPAFVLIHGGCCTLNDWREQVTSLQTTHTVLTPDLRCHGQSTGQVADCTVERWASDINALIDALAIGPAVLVGHSLGARIATEAASQRPDNAAALILLDGSRSVGGFAMTEPPAVTATTLAAILAATIGPYADAATRAHVIATMSAAPMAVMLQTVAAYTDWDSHRADAALAALAPELPVLAIQSTYHDRVTPRRSLTASDETTPYLAWLKRTLPRLEVAILPATGHFSMLERSAEVTALIRDFAKT